MSDAKPTRSVSLSTWHPQWGSEQFETELADYSYSEQSWLIVSKSLDCRLKEQEAEITSLREQLRIAREGLQRCSDDYGDGAPSIAAEYLARMDQEARNDH
jgi:hypothetical protein